MIPLPVYIGYDPVETVAFHTLAHTIIQNASGPVAITPIGNTVLTHEMWWRPRGPHDSSQFSNARFMVPFLQGFKGVAIYMDCDQLCFGDVYDLAAIAADDDESRPVWCRQHFYEPKTTKKYLDQPQTTYQFKNWSSLMVFNCSHPDAKRLTRPYVNDAPGLDLHQFRWCELTAPGKLPNSWNILVGEEGAYAEQTLNHVHFTIGGPWHGMNYEGYSDMWVEYLCDMLGGINPCATVASTIHGYDKVEIELSYHALDRGEREALHQEGEDAEKEAPMGPRSGVDEKAGAQ